MIIAMKLIYLYDWIDGIKVLLVNVFLNIIKIESWTRTNKRKYQRKIENYNLKNIVLKSWIKKICNEHVVQFIDTKNKSVKKL